MSIGPNTKEDENFKISATKKAAYLIGKSVSSFWEDPLKKIFYLALLACIVGLVLGHRFPFEFYLILGIISVVEAYLFFAKQSTIFLSDNQEKK